MASIAPTVLFCERCSSARSDVATGSFVGPAAMGELFAIGAGDGACANPVAAHRERHAIIKIVFTVSLLGTPAYTRHDSQVIFTLPRSFNHREHRGHREISEFV